MLPSSEEQREYDVLCATICSCTEERAIELVDTWLATKDQPASSVLASYQSVRPFETGRWGATLLHMVCDMKFRRAFDHIISLNADATFLNKIMDDGCTALILCNIKESPHSAYMTKRLVECGADYFARRTLTSSNAFYLACESQNLESAKFLLSTMLHALGIHDRDRTRQEDIEAIRQITTRSDTDATVLHASVTRGIGDQVLRWLTSPECAVLWTGRDIFFGINGKYRMTVLTEAVHATRIHMPTIRYVFSLYNDHPISASSLLQFYLEATVMRHHDHRPTSVVCELIEFLYEEASRQPDFAIAQVHCNALKCILKHARPDVTDFVACIRRLVVDKYPQQYPRAVIDMAVSMFTDDRYKDFPHMVCLLVLLDWYEYSADKCAILYDVRAQCPPGIVEHYARRVRQTEHASGSFLFKVMMLGDGCSDFWMKFIPDTPDAQSRLYVSLVHFIYAESRYMSLENIRSQESLFLCCNHVRFMVWVMTRKELFMNCDIAVVLSCYPDAHRVLPVLLTRGLFKINCRTVCGLGRSMIRSFPLLCTVMWFSNMRPTVVCASLLGHSDRLDHIRQFKRHLCWIYNVRTMIKEPKEPVRTEDDHGRIVLGPRTSSVIFLPLPITRNILAFLWQQDDDPLFVVGLNLDTQR